MANKAVLTLVGDSTQLEKALERAGQSTSEMGQKSIEASQKFEKGMSKVASGAAFLTSGLSNLGDSIGTIVDLSRDGAERADRLARSHADVAQAALDVEQAMRDAAQATLDFEQAGRDAAQAAIDVEQAMIDVETAQTEYNKAVAKFGPGSIEARQASLDLRQANEDLAQAQLDAKQATEDAAQALLDAQQATQDATTATLDMNEANRELSAPQGLTVFMDWLSALTPMILTGIGAVQLFGNKQLWVSGVQKTVTAAQWAWNAAMSANPIGLIIAAIVALIAIFVLLWTKCDWFRNFWIGLWDKLKAAASAVGSWFKDTLWGQWLSPVFDWIGEKASAVFGFFKELPGKIGSWLSGIKDTIINAFKGAFNWVTDQFNKVIGGINAGIRGFNAINPFGDVPEIPMLPKFHSGSGRIVPGVPGTEVLAVLRAGERVYTSGQSGPSSPVTTTENVTVNVTVDVDDLRQLQDLDDFLSMLRNNTRRGLVNA